MAPHQKGNRLRRPSGVFVEAVSQSSNYSQNIDLTGGAEQDFELHLAFDPKPPRLLRVGRPGFLDNLRRAHSSWR